MEKDKDLGAVTREPLYSSGDLVEIIRYGSLVIGLKGSGGSIPLVWEDDTFEYRDWHPQWVGQKAIIEYHMMVNGIPAYSLKFQDQKVVKGGVSWFSEQQLKLIKKNPNTINENPAANSRTRRRNQKTQRSPKKTC